MANLTEDITCATTQELFCTTGSFGAYQKLLISVVNIVLPITTFLGNFLIIVGLEKVSSLPPPSKLSLG